jgi:GT2 family glycosyltransferase
MSSSGARRAGTISVSVVSHDQGALVERLLEDLARLEARSIEVILTVNVPEALGFEHRAFPYALRVIRNASPKGFAANHNAAFERATGEFFCVVNPDIRLTSDPFPSLLAVLEDPAVGVAAPLVVNEAGAVEDSARPFPTPWEIALKALGRAPRHHGAPGGGSSPDWVGGMFMLFRADTFAEIGGFDAAYRLYYEDVDLCARLRLAGYDVRLSPQVSITHLARRASHRNPRLAIWHLRSMLRFFVSRSRRAGSLRRGGTAMR